MTLLLNTVLFTVVYVVQAASQNVELLEYDNQPNIGNGNYYFTYMTSDGTSRTETGQLGKESDGSEALVVTGSYSYVGDNGRTYLVNYGAGKNGYYIVQTPKGPSMQNVPEPVVIEEDITKNVAVGKRINSALLGSLVGGGIG